MKRKYVLTLITTILTLLIIRFAMHCLNKDYTHKKNMSMENRKDNMNDLYNIREVKIKKEVNERNQSYQNDKK